MAKFIHNSLAAIFKKIGARENSKEVIGSNCETGIFVFAQLLCFRRFWLIAKLN